MNSFLRGVAPIGASQPSATSPSFTRSARHTPDASLANASPPPQLSGSSSPPLPSYKALSGSAKMTGIRSLSNSASTKVEPLTVSMVKRFEKQLKQEEEKEYGRSSRELDVTWTTSGRTPQQQQQQQVRGGTPSAGEPQSTVHQVSTRDRNDDGDSEELDVYNSRTVRQIRVFLEGMEGEDFTLNPKPTDDVDGDDCLEEEERQQRRIEAYSLEELRALFTEAHTELIAALYDAITLETNLVETDEDAAVLERGLEERNETIELLRMQLTTADEYTEELHDAKKEALRKLSDSKAELAILSQRNTKLLKLLDGREEKLQSPSAANSLASSLRPSTALIERKDASTETEAPAAPQADNTSPLAVTAAEHKDEASRSGFSASADLQQELEDAQEELRLARDTLQATETARIHLQEQVQEMVEAAKRAAHAKAQEEMRRKEDEHNKTERALTHRCKESEDRVTGLQEELRQLRAELEAAKAKVEEAAAMRVAPSSGENTPVPSASPVRPEASREASSDAAASPHSSALFRSSVSQSQSGPISAEAQLAVLQRQLARSQAEATRLEQELHAEREKTQRQSQSEKKLLENVTYLTRQLRAREALEREARSIRRAEQSTARGDGETDEGSEARRSRFAQPRSGRAEESTSSTATTTTASVAAAPATTSGPANGTATAAPQTTSANRYATPEVRRRRENIFAALREAHKATDERQARRQEANKPTSAASSPEAFPLLNTEQLSQERKKSDAGTQQQQQQPQQPQPQKRELRSQPPPPQQQQEPQGPAISAEEPKIATPRVTLSLALPVSSSHAAVVGASNDEGSQQQSSSSLRISRYSALSQISPRGRRNEALHSPRADVSAERVRTDESAAPHISSIAHHSRSAAPARTKEQMQQLTPPASAPIVASTAERRQNPLREASVSVDSNGHINQNNGSATTIASSNGASAKRVSSSAGAAPGDAAPTMGHAPSLFTAVPAAAAAVPSPSRVSRGAAVLGQSASTRASSSTRPAGARSSSVGAGTHRITSTPALSSTSPTTSTTGKGSTIVRGLAATLSGPVTIAHKRTASRRITTGRESKSTAPLTSTREGSTAVSR